MRPSYGYVPAPVENILVVAGATRVAMSLGMVRVTFVPLRGPSGLLALRMMRHDERAVRHVAHDRGTRRDINVVAKLDRRNQLRVASDHAAVADSRLVLVVAIVVDRDNATSDVGLAPDHSIAEVAQMARFGATSDT